MHILVLAPLVIRNGRVPAWQSLYLAGILFGMYEAYMTKILWAPSWNPQAFRLGGVAVVDFIMLVFFWHPVMAFLLPLLVTEKIFHFEPSIWSTIDPKWKVRLSQKRNLIIACVLAGLALGSMLGDASIAVVSAISNSLVFLFAVWIWKKTSKSKKYTLSDFLPRGKSWIVLFILLILDYILLGNWLRLESLPPIQDQATIWFLYLVFFLFLFLARRNQAFLPPEIPIQQEQSHLSNSNSGTHQLVLLLLIASSSTIFSSIVLAPIKNFVFLAVWGFGIPNGIILLIRSISWLFLKKSEQTS